MTRSVANDFSINAAWEPDESSGARCRWFLAWKELEGNILAGAVAGYAGGATYSVESFWGRLESGEFSSLWIDLTDRISHEEIDFSSLGPEVLALCQEAEDLIWEWNDYDVWCDRDAVRLRYGEGKESLLTERNDLFRLERGYLPAIREVCEFAGLTAAPNGEKHG